MSGQIRLRVRYKTYAEPWYDYLLVSPQEMLEILKESQWKNDGYYDFKPDVFYEWYVEVKEASTGEPVGHLPRHPENGPVYRFTPTS